MRFLILVLLACVLGSHAGTSTTRAELMLQTILDYVRLENTNPTEACFVAGGRPGIFTPVGVARAYRTVAVAMYNAWSYFDEAALPALPALSLSRPAAAERTEANKNETVTYAAYWAINYLLPERTLASSLAASLKTQYGVDVAVTTSTAATVAKSTWDAFKVLLDGDLSNQANCYADTGSYYPINNPTKLDTEADVLAARTASRKKLAWSQLVRTGFVNAPRGFTTPHAMLWTPFAVRPLEILPPPLPTETDITPMYQQVVELQQQLDDDAGRKRVIAEFWADGPKTTLPPGHWMELTMSVCRQKNYGIDNAVRIMFLTGNAEYDAGIACWAAKRYYGSVRPATFINTHLYPLLNTTIDNSYRGPYCPLGKIQAWQWQPYQASTFITPPFPEYVSGHSTFSRAAADVLEAYTKSANFPVPYTVTIKKGMSIFEPHCFLSNSTNLYGQPCTPSSCSLNASSNSENEFFPETDVAIGPFTTFKQAADDAGISRLYGGIHITAGDQEGRKLGAKVATAVFAEACTIFGSSCTELPEGTTRDEPSTDSLSAAARAAPFW